MKRWMWVSLFGIAILGIGLITYVAIRSASQTNTLSPIGSLIKEKPLDKYTIDNLSQRQFTGSNIVLSQTIATTSAYTVYQFHFMSDGKKVTGLAHIPSAAVDDLFTDFTRSDLVKKFPVVVQFRGYAPRETYSSGVGTKRSAEVYASNGFISLAPDFLGYGGSDTPSSEPLEERFQTYTTALNLLAALKNFPIIDTDNIFLWGHSNGGQIALTVLTILGKNGYPTTLWAPVSKPFPFNILAYTDEFDDRGKALRKVVAQFDQEYDADFYSMTQYYDRIKAPLQVHQGTADQEVPYWWSDELVATLENDSVPVQYFTYPGADHNMNGAWNTVVARDIQFFTNQLQ